MITKRALGIACFLVGLAVSAYFSYMEEQGNFHPITPGVVYRSAQLDGDELVHYIRKFGIRSVINLRGENQVEPWYREEVATCRDLGVGHYDFSGLSARREPSSRDIENLLGLFHRVPRPVRIHCQGGADRSGLAAALWKVANDGASATEGRKQLSIWYGHLPFGPTGILDAFFDKWAAGRAFAMNQEKITEHALERKKYAFD